MKTVIKSILITSTVLMLVQYAQAQGKLNATFRPSANFPVNDLGTTELKNGGGFGVNFSYRFMSQFSGYAGWCWDRFSPAQSDNTVAHFEETGYRFGLQFIQPLSVESKLNLHLGAGGVGHHIEAESEDGDIIDDSGHGLGWEVEVGLSFPISKRWQIVPDIRYHSLSREMMTGTTEESVDLNYISVGVGVSWTIIDK